MWKNRCTRNFEEYLIFLREVRMEAGDGDYTYKDFHISSCNLVSPNIAWQLLCADGSSKYQEK